MLVDVAGSTIQNENSGIFLPRTLLTGPKVIHIDQEIGKIDQYWDRFARWEIWSVKIAKFSIMRSLVLKDGYHVTTIIEDKA